MARDSGSSARSLQTAASDTAKEPTIAAHATAPAAGLPIRRPELASSRKPRNGRSGIRSSIDQTQTRRLEDTKNQMIFRVFVFSRLVLSPFEERERVGVERLPVPEEADDDREADGRFGGRDRHHEEHDDL